MSKIQVIAGPFRQAQKYAQAQGLDPDEFMIVTRAHQLAGLDPARIARIVVVKLAHLGERIVKEIKDEIESLTVLWPKVELAVG